MRTLLGLSVVPVIFVLAAGCSSDEPKDTADDQSEIETSSSSSGAVSSSSSSGGSSSSSGGSSSGAAERCKATFVWLQKDAYKETGGRTTDLWPPHTTTTLAVECDGAAVASAFMANHGSEPGSKDAEGNDFLAETRRVEVNGTRAELTELLGTYQGCECEPESFLSMNSLDQDVVADLLGEFTTLIEGDTVTCPDDTKDDLVTALNAQDFESALVIVPTCTWPGPDGNPAQTLSDALQTVIATTGGVLDDFHVCNNDAKLQADLVTGFQTGGAITACPRNTDTCKGPMWFYNPNP